LNAYFLSPSAEREVIEAAAYVSRTTGDSSAADVLVHHLYDSFLLISAMPRLGRPRPEFGRGMRSHVVDRFHVFYVAHRHGVEIMRVLHQRRDLRAAFARRKRRKFKLTPEFEDAVWDRVDSGHRRGARRLRPRARARRG
jgi:toxin ParE1/3/4